MSFELTAIKQLVGNYKCLTTLVTLSFSNMPLLLGGNNIIWYVKPNNRQKWGQLVMLPETQKI